MRKLLKYLTLITSFILFLLSFFSPFFSSSFIAGYGGGFYSTSHPTQTLIGFQGLGIDKFGNIYIGFSMNEAIYVFDQNGNSLGVIDVKTDHFIFQVEADRLTLYSDQDYCDVHHPANKTYIYSYQIQNGSGETQSLIEEGVPGEDQQTIVDMPFDTYKRQNALEAENRVVSDEKTYSYRSIGKMIVEDGEKAVVIRLAMHTFDLPVKCIRIICIAFGVLLAGIFILLCVVPVKKKN